MAFIDVVKSTLVSVNKPVTPQEIREYIKIHFPQYYGTPSHHENVGKGHYKNLDHAILAQIYSLVRKNSSFFCNTSCRPMRITLQENSPISEENLILKSELIILNQKLKTELQNKEIIIKNEDELIRNIAKYHSRSMDVAKDFGGPSIYFHVQTIKELETNFLSDRHIELIYATLASWGMHKMGDPDVTKAKLTEFNDFKKSIKNYRSSLQEMSLLRMDLCSQEEYGKYIDNLKPIYDNLKVSISDSTIVANSKTLAHILPNLIPPIDRQYTIRFFTQEAKNFFSEKGKYRMVSVPQGKDAQFTDFKKYSCKIKMIFDQCDHKLFTIDKESFNTSYPKIMDNLIMAFVKHAGSESRKNLKNISALDLSI